LLSFSGVWEKIVIENKNVKRVNDLVKFILRRVFGL